MLTQRKPVLLSRIVSLVSFVREGAAGLHTALAQLDAEVVAIGADRLADAHHRMDSKALPYLREYDLISGLAGLGAYLLHRGHANALERVLRYVVRLITEPLNVHGHQLPGWWAATGLRDTPDT
ncbi:hypothetical protein ACFVZC_07725 [Streptomyces marokkonensis]|uniref:Uncharacterized protein n=1 Tax=Streptomyces marokkonensis TaxID=324855 RepID=A0ABW6Q352_9ACTN